MELNEHEYELMIDLLSDIVRKILVKGKEDC